MQLSPDRGVFLSWHAVPWRLLVDRPRPGADNMARDQALLDLAASEGIAVLRLYRWAPHCLSFGRHEPALRRYHRDQITSLGLDCVRRPTGGRAVWHARELTYAVAAPVALFGSLKRAYQEIHEMLAGAVTRLGGNAALAPAPPRAVSLDAGACFAGAVGGEVMVDAAKVIGSAQLQQGEALLQHGSLLLEDTQAQVDAVTRGPAPRSAGAPLSELLRRTVSFEEAAEAVESAARERIENWRTGDFRGLEQAAAAHLARFQSPEWTWRR